MNTKRIFNIIFLLFGLSSIIIDPLIPYISEQLQAGYDKIGIALLIGSIFSLAAAFISGILCDKFRIRNIIIVGLAMLFIGSLVFAIHLNFVLLVIVLIFLRAGFGTIDSSIHTFVAQSYKQSHSPIFLELDIFWYLGAVTGPLFISLALFSGMRPNNVFFILALAFIIILILFYFHRKKTGTEKLPKGRTIDFKPVLKAVKDPVVAAVSLLLFFSMGAMIGLSTWLTTYFTSFNVRVSLGSIVLSGFWLFSSAGLYLSKKLLPRTNEITLLIAGSLAGTLFLAATSFASNIFLKIIFILLHALFFSVIFTLSISISAYQGSKMKGTVIGFNIAIAISGGLLFRPVLGFVAEYLGKGNIIYLTLAGAVISFFLAIILFRILKQKSGVKIRFSLKKKEARA